MSEIVERELFLSPHMEGDRFDDHTIPLDLLRDLAEVGDLIRDAARWFYLKDNQRRRLPKGFADRFSLCLEYIKEGSAEPRIIAKYHRPETVQTALFDTVESALERAKTAVKSAIDAASRGEDPSEFLPMSLLVRFEKIGRNLYDGEYIDFSSDRDRPARLDKVSRRNLILSSPDNTTYSERIRLKGKIATFDNIKSEFSLLTNEHGVIRGYIVPEFREQIFDSAKKWPNERVEMVCISTFDRLHKIKFIDIIEDMQVIDPKDISEQVLELKELNDGWLNGSGIAPSKAGLDWIEKWFSDHYPDTLELPYMFPTDVGGVQLEWNKETEEIHFEINLNENTGYLFCLNKAEDTYTEFDIDLNKREEFQKFIQVMTDFSENE
jgi:hypothetical protein